MNWCVYTVRVVLVLLGLFLLVWVLSFGFFFPLPFFKLVNKFEFLNDSFCCCRVWFVCSLAAFQRHISIYLYIYMTLERSWALTNVPSVRNGCCWGAAGSCCYGALLQCTRLLSKQHIFLVCAGLVLAPCILPHGFNSSCTLLAESQPRIGVCSLQDLVHSCFVTNCSFAPFLAPTPSTAVF